MITIDGSVGGGQLLRSSLSLSLITGQAFRLTRVRGARLPKPGLMRQHLTCVLAAAGLGDAETEGTELGSQELVFRPRALRAGDWRFSIGSGGSTMLVLQTVLPPLLLAGAPSSVELVGGTHNPLAPTFEFIGQAFLPVLRRMGAEVSMELLRPGYMNAGGGEAKAVIRPLAGWRPLDLHERGEVREAFGIIRSAHLPARVASREKAALLSQLGWPPERVALINDDASSVGPGNAVMAGVRCENVTEMASAIGQPGRSGDAVAMAAAKSLGNYLGNGAPVGPHLADQLLLPMALAGEGAFTTYGWTKHMETSLALIPNFLPVRFRVTEESQGRKRIEVARPG